MAKLTPMKAIRKNVLNVLAEVSTKLNYVLLKNAPSIRIDSGTDLYRVGKTNQQLPALTGLFGGHRPVQGRENPMTKTKLKTHKLGADF